MHSSQHHSFDIHLAAKYGVIEAILIHHFQHWIRINKKLGRNLHEGRTWTYQTINEIQANFSYLTIDQVRQALDKLCNGKTRFQKEQQFEPVLIKGNFNNTPFDTTLWYAFVNDCSHLVDTPNGMVDPPNREVGSTIPDSVETPNIYKEQILNTDTYRDSLQESHAPSEKNRSELPPDKNISFDDAKGFVNVSEEDILDWSNAYPHAQILIELNRMKQWILSNPTKKKKNWRRFITTWLSKASDKEENKKAFSKQPNNTSASRIVRDEYSQGEW